ncbi:MAG: mechanosensitive ion channel family protein [Fimbriimonas sp.]
MPSNDIPSAFIQALRGIWQPVVERFAYIVAGLLVFALFIFGARLFRTVVRRFGDRAGMHANLVELFSRIATFVITVLGIFVAAVIIFPTFQPGDLVAGLGLTTVAVGFAFKDILQNFFAGILLLWRQPFQTGDEIRFGEFEGVVEEINSRSTRILTYDGERAVIPNGDIYTGAVLVRTAKPQRRVRFTVGIGYRDRIVEAREVILRTLDQTEGVLKDPGPWAYVTTLAPSSVDFTVYFWTDSPQRNVLKVSDAAVEAVKDALDAAGIDIPYPHQVNLPPSPPPTPSVIEPWE